MENICNRGLEYGLLVLAFCLPISIAATNVALGILLILWLGLMIARRRIVFEKTVIFLPFLVFLLISIISALGAVNIQRGFRGIKSDLLVLVFFIVASNLGSRRQIKRVLYWFLIGAILVSFFGLLQFVLGVNESGGVITHTPRLLAGWPDGLLKIIALHTKRVVSTRSHPLTLSGGLLLVLSLFAPFLLYKGWKEKRMLIICGSMLIFAAFFLTHSRGPLLALIGALFFIELISRRGFFPYLTVVFLTVIALLIGGLLFIDRDFKAKRFLQIRDPERVYMWQSGIAIISDNPLLGVGPKNVKEVYEEYRMPSAKKRENWGELHNNFVQIGSERGILGLGAFLWIWISLFLWSIRAYRETDIKDRFRKLLNLGCLAALVGFHLSGIFEYNYGDSEVLMMLWFIMGLNVAICKKSAAEMDKKNFQGGFVVFLDRDGTICQERGYINHPQNLQLLPGAGRAVRMLNETGALAIVATNQSGVARDFFSEDVLNKIHRRLEDLLSKEDAYLDKIYYCPHHKNAIDSRYKKDCECRKPNTGMYKRACKEFNLEGVKHYMIGDRMVDVEWGHRIGAESILVLTGYGRGEFEYQQERWKEKPDFIAQNLLDAVRWVLKREQKRK